RQEEHGLSAELVGENTGQHGTKQAADKGTAHRPSLLRGIVQTKELFVKGFGAPNYYPVISEQQAPERGNKGNRPDIGSVIGGMCSCRFGLNGSRHAG